MQKPLVSIIIPTLNEEQNIINFFRSLKRQTYVDFEIIVVDGGSKDETVNIAHKYNAKVKIIEKLGEFESRNVGVGLSNGGILIHTCADVVFPDKLIEKVVIRFSDNKNLIGLTGPGIPIHPPQWGKIEYILYNNARYFASKLKIYSISTNFLACTKNIFNEIGGFNKNEVNADGLFGKELAKRGEIIFDKSIYVNISSRRLWEMGFLRFNLLFLYVLENFIPVFSYLLKSHKIKAKQRHHESHEI